MKAMMMIKKGWRGAGLLLGVVALLAAPQVASADYFVNRDTPDWFKESFLDFPEDVSEAADGGKRLMIYFGQDGCPYCEHLHNINFRQADLLDFMQTHFDSIAVNIFGDVDTVWTDGEDYTEKTLAQKLGIQFTPSLMFLDEEGGEVLRLSGYQPPEKFAIALRYAATYPNTDAADFQSYMRAQLQNTPKSKPLGDELPSEFAAPPYDLQTLAKNGKPLVAFIVQDDCPYCQEWQDYLRSNDEAQQFDIVRLDMFSPKTTLRFAGGGKTSEAQWTSDNDIAFVPALVFFDDAGKEVFRVDGYLRSYHLSSSLDYVRSGAYKTEPEFQRFLQARADRDREQGKEVVIW